MRGIQRTRLLLAVTCIGAAGAFAPFAAGAAQASQVATSSMTVVTDGTWTTVASSVNPGTVVGTDALAECQVSYGGSDIWPSISGASWIWANWGQASCLTPVTGTSFDGPGSLAAWGSTIQTTSLETSFTVPGDPQSGWLTIAADNAATVDINGTQVESVGGFNSPTPLNVSTALVPGANTITINGTNATGTTNYNPAGVSASLAITYAGTSAGAITNLCKNGAWSTNTAVSPDGFTNEGDCVSYYVSKGTDPT